MGVFGTRLAELKEDSPTLLPDASTVQADSPDEAGLVGIESRFWTLLIVMEVVVMGMVRGWVRADPL